MERGLCDLLVQVRGQVTQATYNQHILRRTNTSTGSSLVTRLFELERHACARCGVVQSGCSATSRNKHMAISEYVRRKAISHTETQYYPIPNDASRDVVDDDGPESFVKESGLLEGCPLPRLLEGCLMGV